MPLAVSKNGTVLLDFMRLNNTESPLEYDDIPVTFTMVGIRHENKYVFVHNMKRQQWEIPGGGLEIGETMADCAQREVWEESSQRVSDLAFKGLIKIKLANNQRIEFGAIYIATLNEVTPFAVNNEMDGFILWDLEQNIGDVGAISKAVLKLAYGI